MDLALNKCFTLPQTDGAEDTPEDRKSKELTWTDGRLPIDDDANGVYSGFTQGMSMVMAQ